MLFFFFQGDAGAPLICNGVISGVTSWGENCARSRTPGVYTDISKFFDFIHDGCQDEYDIGIKGMDNFRRSREDDDDSPKEGYNSFSISKSTCVYFYLLIFFIMKIC